MRGGRILHALQQGRIDAACQARLAIGRVVGGQAPGARAIAVDGAELAVQEALCAGLVEQGPAPRHHLHGAPAAGQADGQRQFFAAILFEPAAQGGQRHFPAGVGIRNGQVEGAVLHGTAGAAQHAVQPVRRQVQAHGGAGKAFNK
ncbi:hypothetical protein D3C72_1033600 [compost metagenome]